MPIDGTWYNELGSVLMINSAGNAISGTYQTAVGDAQGIYNLTGFINNDAAPAVGWVVLWSNEFGDSNSLTTWAGQYFSNEGTEVILTMWLMRSEGNEQQNWAATNVGEDVFQRSQGSALSSAVAHLRQPAHPVA